MFLILAHVALICTLCSKLVEASKQTARQTDMMKTIQQQESDEVGKTSALIRAEVAANEEAAVSTAFKAVFEADLAEASPALDASFRFFLRKMINDLFSCFVIAAFAALDILKPSDITLLKSMKKNCNG